MEDSQGISIVKIPLISNSTDGKTPTGIQNHYDVTMALRTKINEEEAITTLEPTEESAWEDTIPGNTVPYT